MDNVSNILREGVIVLGLMALIFGVGFGLLRLRRAMGGGIDDHLRLSTSPTLAKVVKIFLAITTVIWIVVWLSLRDEYGGNLSQALDGLMETVVPDTPVQSGAESPDPAAGAPIPPTR